MVPRRRARCVVRSTCTSGQPTREDYAAVQKLRRPSPACTARPLRLLAWEVAGLNADPEGRPDLQPGHWARKRKVVAGSRHVACTVEMADVRRPVDVAVIDEAHLLGDAADRATPSRAPCSACPRRGAAPVRRPRDGASDRADRARPRGAPHRPHVRALQPMNVLRDRCGAWRTSSRVDCLVAFSRKSRAPAEARRRDGRAPRMRDLRIFASGGARQAG